MEIRRKIAEYMATFDVCESHEVISSHRLVPRDNIREEGLSSPYIIVVPYLIMSLVNLICSALVSSYTHVTALSMENESLPEINLENVPLGWNGSAARERLDKYAAVVTQTPHPGGASSNESEALLNTTSPVNPGSSRDNEGSRPVAEQSLEGLRQLKC